jgi:K+-transporting ATPase KdpF subunit
MDPCNDVARALCVGLNVRIPRPMRARVEGKIMILLTVLATVFLFIYLTAALLRPEWF